MKNKKLIISILILLIILFNLIFYSCTYFSFSKKLSNEKDLSLYIDKYPILGFLYIEQINIKKALLTIKNNTQSYPLINLTGSICLNKKFLLEGTTQVGSATLPLFKVDYDYSSHSGFIDYIMMGEKYEISSESLKISKSLMNYFEKNIFLFLLFLKNNVIPNYKNGEFTIEDLNFFIEDYKIIKAEIDSQILKFKVEYSNYKKWKDVYYPSILHFYFMDYDIKILILDSEFILSFH